MRKAAKPVDEELGGEVRRDADRQRAGPLPLAQPLRAERDPVERVAHSCEIIAARLRQRQPARRADKKRGRKIKLQRLDLLAHRALRDAKLFGGAGERAMPRGGLESAQGVQGRQIAGHKTSPALENLMERRESMVCAQAGRRRIFGRRNARSEEMRRYSGHPEQEMPAFTAFGGGLPFISAGKSRSQTNAPHRPGQSARGPVRSHRRTARRHRGDAA